MIGHGAPLLLQENRAGCVNDLHISWTYDQIQTKFSLPRHAKQPEIATKYSSQVKPISYLKSHAAEVAATLAETRRPLVITQNGEARLVVMDVRTYEEQEETMALLKLLALGHKAMEKGEFRSAEDVFSDLDELDRA